MEQREDIVVDEVETGAPVRGYLYHGSREDDLETISTNTPPYRGGLGHGVYAAERGEADRYGDYIYRLPVDLKNPFQLSPSPVVHGRGDEYDQDLLGILKRKGLSFLEWYENQAGYGAEVDHPYGDFDDAVEDGFPEVFTKHLSAKDAATAAELTRRTREADAKHGEILRSDGREAYHAAAKKFREEIAVEYDRLEKIWDEWPENNIPIMGDSVLSGESVPPFWFVLKGEVYGVFDGGAMEDVVGMVEEAGHDALFVSNLRSDGGHEVVLFEDQVPDMVFHHKRFPEGRPVRELDEAKAKSGHAPLGTTTLDESMFEAAIFAKSDPIDTSGRIVRRSISGTVYHGTAIEKADEWWQDLERHDDLPVWVTPEEDAAREFSDGRSTDARDIFFVNRYRVSQIKLAMFDVQAANKIMRRDDPDEHDDMRMTLARHVEQKGYDGWLVTGGLGYKTYEDIALFDGSDASYEATSFRKSDGSWTEYMDDETSRLWLHEHHGLRLDEVRSGSSATEAFGKLVKETLYHGTSVGAARKIEASGYLRPGQRPNDVAAPARPGHVYLTRSLEDAWEIAESRHDDPAVVVASVEPSRLAPDEDEVLGAMLRDPDLAEAVRTRIAKIGTGGYAKSDHMAGYKAFLDETPPNDPLLKKILEGSTTVAVKGRVRVTKVLYGDVGATELSERVVETPGVAPRSFTIKDDETGAFLTGYHGGEDMPGEAAVETRGSIFYVEVPGKHRRKGIGLKLAKEALAYMSARGARTVTMNPVSSAGRALVAGLLRDGSVSGPVGSSETGKAEYAIRDVVAEAVVKAKVSLRDHLLKKHVKVVNATVYHGTPMSGLRSMLEDGIYGVEHSEVFEDETLSTSLNMEMLRIFSGIHEENGLAFRVAGARFLILDDVLAYLATEGRGSGIDLGEDVDMDKVTSLLALHDAPAQWAKDGFPEGYISSLGVDGFMYQYVYDSNYRGRGSTGRNDEAELCFVGNGIRKLQGMIDEIVVAGETFEADDVKGALAAIDAYCEEEDCLDEVEIVYQADHEGALGETVFSRTELAKEGTRAMIRGLLAASDPDPSLHHAAFVVAASRWLRTQDVESHFVVFGADERVVLLVSGLMFDGDGEQDPSELADQFGHSRFATEDEVLDAFRTEVDADSILGPVDLTATEALLVEDVLPAVERATEILGDRRAALAVAEHDPYPDKRMTPTVAGWIKRKAVRDATEHAHDVVRFKDLRSRLKGLRVPATNQARTAEVKRLLAYDPTAARAPHEIAAWNAEVARLVDPDADLSPGDLPVVGRHGGFTMYEIGDRAACDVPLVKNAMSWCVTKDKGFGEYGGPPYFAVVRDSDKSPFAMIIPAYFETDPDEAVRNGTNSGRLSALDLRKIRPLVRLALPLPKDGTKIEKTYLGAIHADRPQVPRRAPESSEAALRTIRDRVLAPGEWPAGEATIAKDAKAALTYARDVIGRPWPEGEAAIARDAWAALLYARNVIKGRFSAGEAAIATDDGAALLYARNVIKGRFSAGEAAIATDAGAALLYARDVIKGKFPEGEAAIAKSALVSLAYARDIVKGRWPEGEAEIAKSAMVSLGYVHDVVKGRWPEGEAVIARDARAAREYARDVAKGRFEDGKFIPDEAMSEAAHSHPASSRYFYHVTTPGAVASIEREGIKPASVKRGMFADSNEPRAYLFVDRDTAEDALASWLGETETFEGIDRAVLLRVDVAELRDPRPDPELAGAVYVTHAIPVEAIVGREVVELGLDETTTVDARSDGDILYHGTAADEFEAGAGFRDDRPVFFSGDPSYAASYADKGDGRSRVIRARVRVERPFDGSTLEQRRVYDEEFPLYLASKRLTDHKAFVPSDGGPVPFTWANEFWSFLRHRERRDGRAGYDGLLVDEGDGAPVATVPLHAGQIEVVDAATLDESTRRNRPRDLTAEELAEFKAFDLAEVPRYGQDGSEGDLVYMGKEHPMGYIPQAERAERAGNHELAKRWRRLHELWKVMDARRAYSWYEKNEAPKLKRSKDMLANGREFARLTGAKVNPDGSVRVYHGTSKKSADTIERSGKFDGLSFFATQDDGEIDGSGPSNYAAIRARQAGERGVGRVLAIDVDPDALGYNRGSYEIEAQDGLRRGKDGVWRAPKRSTSLREARGRLNETARSGGRDIYGHQVSVDETSPRDGVDLSESIVDVDSSEFRRWFRGSKVVDADGKPLLVFHGSPSEIREFNLAFTEKGNDQLGSGFYFTTSEQLGRGFATDRPGSKSGPGVLHGVYLSIKRPLDAAKVGNLTRAQVEAIVTRSPDLDEHLSNYGDVEYEGRDRVLRTVVESYVANRVNLLRQLNLLSGNFYQGRVREFNEAVRAVLGYDGVRARYGSDAVFTPNQDFWVAWFPEQVRIASREHVVRTEASEATSRVNLSEMALSGKRSVTVYVKPGGRDEKNFLYVGYDPISFDDVGAWRHHPSRRDELSTKYARAVSGGTTTFDRSGVEVSNGREESDFGTHHTVKIKKLSIENGMVRVDFVGDWDDREPYDLDDLPVVRVNKGIELYHATSSKSVPSILRLGLIGRLPRSRHGRLMGNGVYLTPDRRQAEEYWSSDKDESVVLTVRPKRELRLVDVGYMAARSTLFLQLKREAGDTASVAEFVTDLGYDGLYSHGGGRDIGGEQIVVIDGSLLSVEAPKETAASRT